MTQLCTGCELSTWLVTARFHGEIPGNSSSAIEFFRVHGVLPQAVDCPWCKQPCLLKEDKNIWYCPQHTKTSKSKKRKICNFTVSDFKGTFLANALIEPWKVLLFISHWLDKKWDHDAVIQSLNLSSSTSVNWRIYCSKVTEFWLMNQESIGGEGIVVEIDKLLFVKKNNEENHESEIWVFGGMETKSKKKFLIPYEDEKKGDDLITPLIQHHILPGSVLVSESWGTQLSVNDHGYSHHIVNRSKKFMDPDMSGIHTQNISRLCRNVKEWVKRPGVRSEYFMQYFARYLFIHEFQSQLLHHFLVQAARMYPPQSEREPQRTLIIPLFGAPVPAARDLVQAQSASNSDSDTTVRG